MLVKGLGDGNGLLRGHVKAHGCGATWQAGQHLHALHDAPHHGDVAVQRTRALADDGVELVPLLLSGALARAAPTMP